MSEAETNPAPAANVATQGHFIGSVTLLTPIEREGSKIEELQLRAPHGPAVLGCSLYDLMRCDAAEIIKVLPRIAEPQIAPAEAMMLSGRDLFAAGQVLSGFLLQ